MNPDALVIFLVVAIVGIYVLAHFVRKALYRGVNEIDNKIREKKNRENGPAVEELSSIYENSKNESASTR